MIKVPHAGAEMLNFGAWPTLTFSKGIKRFVSENDPSLELWDGIREHPARISAS